MHVRLPLGLITPVTQRARFLRVFLRVFSLLRLLRLAVRAHVHVVLQVLRHPEAPELLGGHNLGQLVVAFDHLLVLGVLQLVLLDVGPHPLDHFVPGHLVASHDVSELLRELDGRRVAACLPGPALPRRLLLPWLRLRLRLLVIAVIAARRPLLPLLAGLLLGAPLLATAPLVIRPVLRLALLSGLPACTWGIVNSWLDSITQN